MRLRSHQASARQHGGRRARKGWEATVRSERAASRTGKRPSFQVTGGTFLFRGGGGMRRGGGRNGFTFEQGARFVCFLPPARQAIGPLGCLRPSASLLSSSRVVRIEPWSPGQRFWRGSREARGGILLVLEAIGGMSAIGGSGMAGRWPRILFSAGLGPNGSITRQRGSMLAAAFLFVLLLALAGGRVLRLGACRRSDSRRGAAGGGLLVWATNAGGRPVLARSPRRAGWQSNRCPST